MADTSPQLTRWTAHAEAKAIAKDPDLRRLAAIVGAFRAANAELPMQQAALLFAIAMRPGLTATEAGEAVGLSQSSTSRNMLALSPVHRNGVPGLGLVEQRPDRDDGRKVCLYLTREGTAFVSNLLNIARHGRGSADYAPVPHAASLRLKGLEPDVAGP